MVRCLFLIIGLIGCAPAGESMLVQDDLKPGSDAPKSPSAVNARRTYEEAEQAANEQHRQIVKDSDAQRRQAVKKAQEQYLERMQEALDAALVAKDLKEANEIDAAIKTVMKEMKAEIALGMKFVLIPAGAFLMGSPNSESGRERDEIQRSITLTLPFEMGIHEVTQAQYESVMDTNPSDFKGLDNPVERVSWDDAVEFCKRLSELPSEKAAGHAYRLPTEAEWEYACRAGTTTAYCFGDDASKLGEYAWFGDNSAASTHPVGQKRPNAWGLYDMHGNVFEWCQDWYTERPRGAVTDPQGPPSGEHRALRGGAWYNAARLERSANRSKFPKPNVNSGSDGNNGNNGYGFRVVR